MPQMLTSAFSCFYNNGYMYGYFCCLLSFNFNRPNELVKLSDGAAFGSPDQLGLNATEYNSFSFLVIRNLVSLFHHPLSWSKTNERGKARGDGWQWVVARRASWLKPFFQLQNWEAYPKKKKIRKLRKENLATHSEWFNKRCLGIYFEKNFCT